MRETGGKLSRGKAMGDDVVVCLPGANIEAITERVLRKHRGFGQGWICFSTRMDK